MALAIAYFLNDLTTIDPLKSVKNSLGLLRTYLGDKDNSMWKISIVCSVIGFIQGVIMVWAANGAPQQAAGAAMGIAWAVIPYCICRAIQQLKPREVVIKQEISQ